MTADERDNDPAVLLVAVAAALDRVDTLPSVVVDAIEAHRPVQTVMARLLAWIYDEREPFTLAIDHVEAVTNPEALDIVTQIGAELPAQHRLLVASRVAAPLARAQAARPRSSVRARVRRPGPRSQGSR